MRRISAALQKTLQKSSVGKLKILPDGPVGTRAGDQCNSFCRALAAEDGDGLHVEGLGKHIDQIELDEFVAVAGELLQVAREGDRIA